MEEYSSANATLPSGAASNVDQSVRKDFVDLLQNKTRTGLWLDSYDHISFLEDALESMSTTVGGPTKIIFLFYDLPNRDCAAGSSNGSLCCIDPANADPVASYCDPTTMADFASDSGTPPLCVGLTSGMIQDDENPGKTYKDYTDRVVTAIENYKDFEYHIVCEPDSFPNILTNSGFGSNSTGINGCSSNTAALSYCAGIDYALRRLTGHVRGEDGNLSPDESTISTMFQNNQIHTYLDVAHSAWGGWDVNLGDPDKGVMYSLLMGATSESPYVASTADAYSKIGTADNFSDGVDENVYTKELFWWNTAQWKQMLSGFTMNVSNYTPLGYMIPFSSFGQNGLNRPPEVIRDYCGWEDYAVKPVITPASINPINSETFGTIARGPECMNPCNNVQAYNFTNNLMNYSGILATIYADEFPNGVAKDGVVYPRILIDTARNGGAPDVFKANYEALLTEVSQPEPCASWCNVASMSLGQPSFGDDNQLLHPSDVTGSFLPFISFAYLKPPGESDGCVPEDAAAAPNPQDTVGKMTQGCTPSGITGNPAICTRFDTMCGHQFAGGYGETANGPGGSTDNLTYTEETKNYINLCPPDAGTWDLFQIDMLASNFSKFTQSTGNQSYYATKNDDDYWDGNSE